MEIRNPKTNRPIIIKDVITDNFLQQILIRPVDLRCHCNLMNPNRRFYFGCLGCKKPNWRLGIRHSGATYRRFGGTDLEVTHGTAAKVCCGKDKINPSSLILSAHMMLEHIGWQEAADYVLKGNSWSHSI